MTTSQMERKCDAKDSEDVNKLSSGLAFSQTRGGWAVLWNLPWEEDGLIGVLNMQEESIGNDLTEVMEEARETKLN